MAFILKSDPTVIRIKLTDKGRELLSRGQLTFTQYGIGDSEIDYTFNDLISFPAFQQSILRPKDKNPEILSFITQELSGDTLNQLPTVVSNTSVITNTAKERGFFEKNDGEFNILSDANWVKQPDAAIDITKVTGGTTLTLQRSSTYGANPTEPVVGDYLLVRWANPYMSGSTTGFDVNEPIPYIWYKIQAISGGTISGDDLVIVVDKPLPDFQGNGSGYLAGALIYPNSNARATSGTSIQTYYGSEFITDFVSEAVIAFLENCDVPTIDVPIWNMSIVFTEEIAGVKLTDRNISQYYTRQYGGFVNYIQQLDPSIKKIGIIHYSNNSPSNNYGEGLVKDTPVLELPTIMWHNNTGATIGITLSADTSGVLELPNLNINYQNLIDDFGNVVGKVFLGLKVFVIEDQELLFAMTYKANRSWTLPPISADFNVSLCPSCDIEIVSSAVTNPTSSGATDGSIAVTVENAKGVLTYSLNGGAPQTSNTFVGLGAGAYLVTVIDDGSPDCEITETITLTD